MIEFRVFNVGRGSSALIRLGDRGCHKYGIIDCYTGPGRKNPLLNFLRERRVDSVEFLIVTHPHRDHFVGIASILAHYNEKIKFFFDSGLELNSIAAAQYPTVLTSDTTARAELESIQLFQKQHPHRVRSIQGPGQLVYRDAQNDIVVESIAPAAKAHAQLRAQLQAWLITARDHLRRHGDATTLPPIKALDFNLVSSAFLISHRGRSLLVGGDVVRSQWERILRDRELPADVVLLSCHGSRVGFPSSHWGKRFGRKGAIAVVSGRGHNQPSRSVRQALAQAGSELHCTGPLPTPGDKAPFVISEFLRNSALGGEAESLRGQDVVATIHDRIGMESQEAPLLEPDPLPEEPPQELVVAAQTISRELIKYLANNPDAMYELRPRQFEELIAEILAQYGWEIDLTPATHDGGYDLFAIQKSNAGVRTSWIVECKKYRRDRKVGVDVVRALYGVRNTSMPAGMIMLATTSDFSRDVRAMKESRYDLELRDQKDILSWLNDYKPKPSGHLYLRDSENLVDK